MVPFIFIHDILIHGRRHAPLRMIHQLESLARVVLREPTVSFGKSTGGDWVLRLPQQVGPQVVPGWQQQVVTWSHGGRCQGLRWGPSTGDGGG